VRKLELLILDGRLGDVYNGRAAVAVVPRAAWPLRFAPPSDGPTT
jgi:hypothetical protein